MDETIEPIPNFPQTLDVEQVNHSELSDNSDNDSSESKFSEPASDGEDDEELSSDVSEVDYNDLEPWSILRDLEALKELDLASRISLDSTTDATHELLKTLNDMQAGLLSLSHFQRRTQ
ncbi:hypothetical protein AGABI2DRAFT_113958 [Agaricus bisporus var. bisporus H97]|uniref:hypothetical protein n=1 Tax=Agaricus bisporus var. bisporus (strain H97 / ATCC MYA-4626 / FGSC 10389) TaxID=936046 RepID=UPI00029F5A96|nr:hypothetical protein AGABI2DRAFT_113958 [Agaricus bisporus var. bisporus H97]EKV51219.1 hypothetical protein AGABI2DRAFT_113958 [Agaricus bisporus var. bisporus H97]